MKNYVDQGGCNPGWRSRWITSSKIFIVLNKFPFLKTFFKTLAYFFGMVLGYKLRWPKSVTAISICSRQFQFAHGNFSLLTAISICSRQFQFARGNFNLLIAILILLSIRKFQFYLRRFQFTDGNFKILPKALSIFSQQRSRHFSLCSPPVSYSHRQWPCTEVKTQNQKSIII